MEAFLTVERELLKLNKLPSTGKKIKGLEGDLDQEKSLKMKKIEKIR